MPIDARRAGDQDEFPITFDVVPKGDPDRDDEPDGYLAATLKIGDELNLPHDLQPGEKLTVVVTDADGVVVAQASTEIDGVGFRRIKEKGRVIGMERIHKAKAS